MKKKFNWGTGIFLFIALFFVTAVSFIVWTLGIDVNLVEKDYYPKGLEYNAMKQKIDNTATLSEKITAIVSKDQVLLHFPEITRQKTISGSLVFYRPSDVNKDLNFPIKPDSSANMIIPRNILLKGKYILKFDWKLETVPYYQEIEVYLP